ncbi:MAG TPA: hypothetical protein VJ723_07470 [Candidatus Angelobacter sp.]|nr:hypothetical protein [Candidatus Angelobacter sp.]
MKRLAECGKNASCSVLAGTGFANNRNLLKGIEMFLVLGIIIRLTCRCPVSGTKEKALFYFGAHAIEYCGILRTIVYRRKKLESETCLATE